MTTTHMTLAEFNRHCKTFVGTTKVVQWGDAHVWKVGGKVFAIGGWSEDDKLAVTFKVDRLTFDHLKGAKGFRPAPYLASRGFTWVQWTGPESVTSEELKTYLAESYGLIAAGLSRVARQRLGIEEASEP